MVLAINTNMDEDAKVLELMKKFDFITLKSPHEKYAQETYNVNGTPANFLLDGEGRVIFIPPPVHTDEMAKILELELQTVLAHSDNAKSGSAITK